jgi:hypothetical protein
MDGLCGEVNEISLLPGFVCSRLLSESCTALPVTEMFLPAY